MEKECAVLIDAYSQIFRVFYAIMHLSNQAGFPTNALLGFARLLLQLEKSYAPTRGCMFFDCGKPAFRLELAPGYKSNRPPMPEDLVKQMPLLRKLAGMFGWNVCECSNYEADDLIGAAVKSFPQQKFGIISSDKDLAQLIDEHAFMLIPARSGGGFEKRGIEETQSKFSVSPAQMIDYLSLLGDNSDVIEGVPGIGPKTAANILQQCNSLAEFFAEPARLSTVKLQAKLLEARELLERNRKLITLCTRWPEETLGPADKWLQKRSPDWAQIAEFAHEYELKSILKELPAEFQNIAAAAVPPAAESKKAAGSNAADDLFSWSQEQQTAAGTVEQTEKKLPVQDSLF